MNPLNQSTQISLAIHLGLIATAITILIWRMAESKSTYSLFTKLQDIKQRGFASHKTIRSIRYLIIEFIMRIVGVIISFYLFYLSFQFLLELRKIYGPGNIIDYSLMQKILERSELLTDDAVWIGAFNIILFVINYMFLIWLESRLKEFKDKPNFNFYNTITIPKEMKSYPESLWGIRIDDLHNLNDKTPEIKEMDLEKILINRSWRNDWITWTKCVIAHNVLVSEKLAERRKRMK